MLYYKDESLNQYSAIFPKIDSIRNQYYAVYVPTATAVPYVTCDSAWNITFSRGQGEMTILYR